LMSRRFKRLSDQYDSVTIPDYLESRFRDEGHGIRKIAAIALLVFVPIYAGSQVFATGQAFNAFLGMNHFLGAAIGFAVVLLYITKGGFIAVVWSDVFQGTLMVVGLVLLPIVGLMEIGGVSNVVDSLRSHAPEALSFTAGKEWSPLVIMTIVGFAAIGIGFLGSPQVFVRFVSLRSEKEIVPGALVALTWTILADSGAVLVGIIGRAIYLDVSAIGDSHEDILPFMSSDLMPPFIAGLFIAMVLSAIMSTIDSLLVVASSAGVRDYWQRVLHPDMDDSRLIRLSERCTLVLALIAFVIGMGILLYDKENGVFWVIIFGWSGIAATFCPVMILSLVWSGLTARGVMVGMILGFLCVPFFKFAVPAIATAANVEVVNAYLSALDVLLPAFLVSGTGAITVSLLDRNGRQRLADTRDDLARAAGRRGPTNDG
ncbi:MAG: sodium/proline symporter, partial [Phycisphaerales bacterium]|nr:sodium/proline symporter [Phycisphaerales bacterium]